MAEMQQHGSQPPNDANEEPQVPPAPVYLYWLQSHPNEQRSIINVRDLKSLLEEMEAVHSVHPGCGSGGVAKFLGLKRGTAANYCGLCSTMRENKVVGEDGKQESIPLTFDGISHDTTLVKFAKDFGFQRVSNMYGAAGDNSWPKASEQGLDENRVQGLIAILNDKFQWLNRP